jgi:hypothetical protein
MHRAVLAVFLGLATTAAAQPPPASNPAAEAAILQKSCPAGDEAAKPATVTVKSQSVSVAALEGAHDQVGKLLYIGGLKLTSDDARFGDIIGLQFDPKLGLVAATGAGNWIIFDAVGPTLTDFKSVQIAPIRDAAGSPNALVRAGQGYVVASRDGHNLDRYELNACGLSAHAAPIGGLQNADHLVGMAPATSTSTLLAGIDSTGSRRDLVTSGFQAGMKLGEAQFPGQPGYELVDVAGPEVIAPYDMIALWRRAGGSRTRVQAFSMPTWSNIRAPAGAPVSYVLADLPLPMRATTGFYDTKNRLLRLWMISRAGPNEPTYLLVFATQSVTG